MKSFIKNLFAFLLLSFVFSGLLNCKTNQTASNSNNSNAPQNTSQTAQNTTEAKKDSTDYPLVSNEIMQETLTAPDGTTYKLEDLKGKVVLVNLWGIWCGPCKAEMPSLIELQNKYKDKGFEIVGLNVGDENLEKESPESIKNFAEKMQLNYKLAQADDKLYANLLKFSNFGGIPQSFLITRDGKFYGVFYGGGPGTIAKLKANVEKVVNEN